MKYVYQIFLTFSFCTSTHWIAPNLTKPDFPKTLSKCSQTKEVTILFTHPCWRRHSRRGSCSWSPDLSSSSGVLWTDAGTHGWRSGCPVWPRLSHLDVSYIHPAVSLSGRAGSNTTVLALRMGSKGILSPRISFESALEERMKPYHVFKYICTIKFNK